ncbi:MAG: hypothetical protein JKY56_22545 [Kofleriaceae bacterium]|nr:hypothetical protein [Kofleriaceae bacterium]
MFIRGTFPSCERAEQEAMLLRRFVSEYPNELREREVYGEPDEALRSELSARYGFHFDEYQTWGREGSFWEEPTSVSQQGRDVYLFHCACHHRDDFAKIFGKHLRSSGAENISAGRNPGMLIVFELTTACSSNLSAHGAGIEADESSWQVLRDMVDYFSLSPLYPKLAAHDRYRWLFHKDGGNVGEHTNYQGGFFWCDGHRGAIYVPFDGRLDLTRSYFERSIFSRFAISINPSDWLKPICVLRQAQCCEAADLRAVWPEDSTHFTHWHCKHCGREESLASQVDSEGINYYFGHALWAFSCHFDEDSEPRIRLEGKPKARSVDGARRAEAFIEAGIERVGWWHLLGARGELSGKEWPLAHTAAADYCWLGVSEKEGILAVVYDLPDIGSFSEVHLFFPEGDELRASNHRKRPVTRSPISRQLYDASLSEGDLITRVREAKGRRSAQPIIRRKAVRSLMDAFCRETAWKISQMPRALCEIGKGGSLQR